MPIVVGVVEVGALGRPLEEPALDEEPRRLRMVEIQRLGCLAPRIGLEADADHALCGTFQHLPCRGDEIGIGRGEHGDVVGILDAEGHQIDRKRQYRREHRVPMVELGAFIDLLRERTGSPYPLADRRPFVAERQLVHEAQEQARLEAEY